MAATEVLDKLAPQKLPKVEHNDAVLNERAAQARAGRIRRVESRNPIDLAHVANREGWRSTYLIDQAGPVARIIWGAVMNSQQCIAAIVSRLSELELLSAKLEKTRRTLESRRIRLQRLLRGKFVRFI
jgi:hypothetical protein